MKVVGVQFCGEKGPLDTAVIGDLVDVGSLHSAD